MRIRSKKGIELDHQIVFLALIRLYENFEEGKCGCGGRGMTGFYFSEEKLTEWIVEGISFDEIDEHACIESYRMMLLQKSLDRLRLYHEARSFFRYVLP
mgnify:FL=1